MFHCVFSGCFVDLRVLHVKIFQVIYDYRSNYVISEPLVVCGNDVPRGPTGTRPLQYIFVGFHVMIPMLSLRQVVDAELPFLCGVVKALFQPLLS